MEKKKETKKPLTAEDILAMPDDQFHDWVSRRFAERIAESERRRVEEQAEADEPETS